jgi:cytochrome P450
MILASFGRTCSDVEESFAVLEAEASAWRAEAAADSASVLDERVVHASQLALAACERESRAALLRMSGGDAAATSSLAGCLHGHRPEASCGRAEFNLIVAGAESNAVSTAKTLAAVVADAELSRRVRDEVDAAVAAAGGAVTTGAVSAKNCPLLHACVKEGLRLYAPATVAQRTATKPFDLGGGVVLPAGTTVCVCMHALHLDERDWPDPRRFDPARFLPGRPRPPRHAYLPFSAGPRRCPGEAVATTQARAILAEALLRFTTAPVGPVPASHVAGFTEWTAGGVGVSLVPRT